MDTQPLQRDGRDVLPDSTLLLWRRAVPEDAEDLIRIYNESVAGGGHSPALVVGNTQDMRVIVEQSRRMGWPMWVMTAPSGVGDASESAPTARPPVAWAFLRPIAWAPEACSSTGDLWLYVAHDWQGSGIAMRMIRRVFKECRRHGFDAITCWILGSNRRSLSLVRACRLTRWGNLPTVVDYGGLRFDLEIWGCKLDDPVWLSHMDRLERRHASLDARRSA